MTKPIAYQDTTKGRDYIDVAYKTEGNTYGFTIGEYGTQGIIGTDTI